MDEKIFQRQITKLGLSGSLMVRPHFALASRIAAHTYTQDTEAESAGAKGDAFTLDDVSSPLSSAYLLLTSSPQLKSIFKLHTGVACQTHDLLGCRCHLDEPIVEKPPKGEFDSDTEEEDFPSSDDMMAGFVQASQMRDESPVEVRSPFALLAVAYPGRRTRKTAATFPSSKNGSTTTASTKLQSTILRTRCSGRWCIRAWRTRRRRKVSSRLVGASG